jgi:hypothetical protein
MQKVKFLYFFTIIALLNTLAHASGYQNITAGYIFENASVTHPKIDHTDNVTNYAVNLMYTKMHPLFFLRGRVILHPDQYLSKGYSQGNRYTARLNMLDLDFTWGAKYLFSRKFYFIPAISIRYKSATTRFKNIDNSINESSSISEFTFPLELLLGYQYDKRSDLLLGYHIEEDVSVLKRHEEKDLSLTWQHTFGRNPIMNLSYRKTTSYLDQNIKIIHERFIAAIGYNF